MKMLILCLMSWFAMCSLCEVASGQFVDITPASCELDLTGKTRAEVAGLPHQDYIRRLIDATVRVTTNGVCGSGTIVGRSDNKCLVLTNAHVAGSRVGIVVNVERWDMNGQSERSKAEIVSCGYSDRMSVDFALLKVSDDEWGSGCQPIPLRESYPDPSETATTYGCPRCEWPSLQCLSWVKTEGQVLSWRPPAIGGRSGSGVVVHTDQGPRVVALLTWGTGVEGLGQSSPHLLKMIRGAIPKKFDTIPNDAKEIGEEVSVLCEKQHETGLLEKILENGLKDDGIIDCVADKVSEKIRQLLLQIAAFIAGAFASVKGFAWVKSKVSH